MPEFEDRQASLDQARKQSKKAQRELFAKREKQKKMLRMIDALKRNAGDEATNARIDKLTRESDTLAEEVSALRTSARKYVGQAEAELAAFIPFSDPTKNIARLDGKYPILLFPVRIEIRFKKVPGDNQIVDQLWVRIYPDDIAVDTFEEMLAEVEVKNARIYWTNIWKAGGVEGEKRAAWQSLVKSHGAGRAFWIIQQVKPLNMDEEPSKADGDFILVIVTENSLPAVEKPAAQAYWRDVWLANNDQEKIEDALNTLIQAVGSDRADVINADYIPQNLRERPKDESAVANVRVEFLEMPEADQFETQQQPWMHAANTATLPERFVLLGFNHGKETLRRIGNPIPSELAIGPNPSAEPDEQMRLENDELVVSDEMKWMVDFDEAVEKGMGFRVNLPPAQARLGFDRLFVLGIRISADVKKSKEQLETLIEHHQKSRKGFSILPQGTPTNNVEDDQSGYTWLADSDASYDHYFKSDPTDDPTDWRLRKDGRWLAEFLGIDADLLKATPNYYSTDQCEARAMNIALWPATLGSFMEQLMEPVFEDDTINSTREFFNQYVIGRGAIPAIRVGNQPYGILPATPFSRMEWLKREILADDRFDTHVPNQFLFLPRLYKLILEADKTWSQLKDEVSYVGKPRTDPQQVLLDVVGLHPSSVEFYQRYAETLEQLYNRFKYSPFWGTFIAAAVAMAYVASGTKLLESLGYDARKSGIPDILSKFFLKTANLLKGPVIDDRPLSETDPIRVYHENGNNYLRWLAMAARDSHNTLRMQRGFIDERPPTALLYLMLHHALDLSYLDTSFQLHLEANVFTQEQVLKARRKPNFIHIQDAQEDAGSQWQYLYKTEPAITNSQTLTVAEYIPKVLTVLNPYLNKQIQAIEHLKDIPTARIERVFTEHLDCCTYRLDAWWLGLVNVQLGLMRSFEAGGSGTSKGSYLGSFGWLEDVRSENKEFKPVELDEELSKIFNKEGQEAMMRDETNFGYIHAPSLNHAVTAAVLRNGYLSNATPENPGSLSINLTSERVRAAMGIIEGIRNGQSLAALLGYQFERGLHDEENLFLDALILEFRKQFPLVSNRLSSTKEEGDDVSIEAIEARNVVDGLALIEHIQEQPKANQTYPFGLGSKLPQVTDTDKLNAINTQVQRIMNINDAVADLAMAESVYQVVQGNYDRAAGTLDAYSKGNHPPIPEVVQTPRSGPILTHRVGFHFEAGINPAAAGNTTPRSKGEPAINKWLEDYLPGSDDVFCEVEFFDRVKNAVETEIVTQTNLDLLPIDLLYMVNMDGEQQMKALDERILCYVLDNNSFNPRTDSEIKIKYCVKQAGKISFFDLAPYLKNLRALFLSSRPLRPTDIRLPNEADKPEDVAATINESKITEVKAVLDPYKAALSTLLTKLETILNNPNPDIVSAEAIDKIDQIITEYRQIADGISRFGLPGATFAFTCDWRRQQFAALIRKLDDYINRWEDRLADFDKRILGYADMSGDPKEKKFKYLISTASLIWTAAIMPLPSDPDQLRDDLKTNKRNDFVNVLNGLKNILENSDEVSKLCKDIASKALDIAKYDLQKIDIEDNKTAIVAFVDEIRAKTESLSKDITERLDRVVVLLAGDPSADAAKRIDELTEAARQMLGADFVILPEFKFSAEQSAEWQNVWSQKDQLLEYLKNDEAIDFPLDDWLYGVARVREKIHHLESATMLSNALAGKDLELQALQFPFRDNDSWLGLKFPEKRLQYLFNMDTGFTGELDTGGTVSETLQNHFQAYGEPLSSKAEIMVEQAGSSWRIADTNAMYHIKHENLTLNVYKLVSLIDEDKLLCTAHYYPGFSNATTTFCGVLVDEWTERIPTTEETTGLTFHYDRPNTEPPQTLLLATPADFTGQWKWQDLVDTLHETLDLAKRRAVEPQHINSTAYSRFLPAILSEVATWPITPTLNFAYNNEIQFVLED